MGRVHFGVSVNFLVKPWQFSLRQFYCAFYRVSVSFPFRYGLGQDKGTAFGSGSGLAVLTGFSLHIFRSLQIRSVPGVLYRTNHLRIRLKLWLA